MADRIAANFNFNDGRVLILVHIPLVHGVLNEGRLIRSLVGPIQEGRQILPFAKP